MIKENNELSQPGGGVDVHFLAGHGRCQAAFVHFLPGKLQARSLLGDGETEAVVQQLTEQMRAQRIMFAVEECVARGDEVDLATALAGFELDGLEIEKIAHRPGHVLDGIAADHAAHNLAGLP